MEKEVKQMLRHFEGEGESSAKKAEVHYQERPMLIAHVKNVYRMYRALAERYDNVTGELRKNIPSSLQSHGFFGISESDSETQSPPPLTEPEMQNKMSQQKQKSPSDCFDVSIGSGVSSDVSKKGSDGSSSFSESDSELDEAKEENGNSIFYTLSQRTIELEDELHEARGKLDALEEKNMHCQCNFGAYSVISEHEEKLPVSDVETNNLQKDLDEVNSDKEALEAVLLANKYEIDGLKEAMASAAKQFEIELAHRDLEIDKYEQELGVLSEKYLHDKSALEAEIGMLQGLITNFEGDLAKMSQEKLQLESRNRQLNHSASEMVKLQEVIKNIQAELEKFSQEKEETIKNMEDQLERALQEKSILQDRIKELEQVVCDSLEKHSLEKSSLSAEFSKLSETNDSLEAKLASLEASKFVLTRQKDPSTVRSKFLG